MIDDAVQCGLVPAPFVEHIRTTGQFTLIQLLEYVGQSALDRRDDRTAQRLYSCALELGSANANVAYNLGNIAGRAGRSRDAIRHYDAAIKLNPDLALAYYNRGVQRRRIRDELGAQADIMTAITKGYDDLPVYAALLRTRQAELGAPVEALQEGVEVLQILAAGDADLAATVANLNTETRRRAAGDRLGERIALLVALDSEFDLTRRMGETQRAVLLGQELVDLCGALANLDVRAWGDRDKPLRPFVVDRLPDRLIALAKAYEAVGRHDAALNAFAAATTAAGGPESPGKQIARVSAGVADAVYAEMRRRAGRDAMG
jgi:tetratricopeptide (TPR) repeat protein